MSRWLQALLIGIVLFSLTGCCGRGRRQRALGEQDASDGAPAPVTLGPDVPQTSEVPPWPSLGCGSEAPPPSATTITGSLTHDGRERTYRLHLPPRGEGGPMPLVVMLHGGLGTGEHMEGHYLMNRVADREGFAVAYPDGSQGRLLEIQTWNGGGCCGDSVTSGVDDVGFVTALLDRLEQEHCLDRRRIYAAGMSNGGLLSHRLACELSDRIAAIGPVAGTIAVASCAPSRPVPTIIIHGRQDRHVPWEGGVGCSPSGYAFTSIPDTVAGWVQRNGCTGPEKLYLEQDDGRCMRQGSCSWGADVVLCGVEGQGHTWAGGLPRRMVLPRCREAGEGGQSATFDTNTVLWRFFREHPLPVER